MITTAAFTELSPEAQREVILDGMLHLKAEAFRVAKSMSKLSGWLDTLEISQADQEYISRYRRLAGGLQENIDGLTEQILIEAQKLRHIADQIAAKKLSDRINKTPTL